jgi:peptidoglycan/LPS O-acetylase OafA/YrhL
MKNKSLYFHSLDGLRSIACVLVIIAHSFSVYRNESMKGESNPLKTFLDLGQEGVSLFFVLSGFLITYLLIKEFKQNKKINLWHFYIRRTLRIWPLFYLVVIYALFVYPLICSFLNLNHFQNGNVLMNLTFLNNFDLLKLVENCSVGFNQQLQITWSVAIEEQFYLIWPLLFILMARTKKYFAIFFSLFSIILFFRFSSNQNVNYFHSFSAAFDLLTGCLSAFIMTKSDKTLNYFKKQKNSHRIIIYVIGVIIIFSKSILDFYFSAHYLIIIFFAFVILDQSFNQNKFIKLVNFKRLSNIGKYTYGMYLLHPIPLIYLKHIFDFSGISYKANFLNSSILFVLTLAFTIIMSYASYHYLESFFLKLKKKYIAV